MLPSGGSTRSRAHDRDGPGDRAFGRCFGKRKRRHSPWGPYREFCPGGLSIGRGGVSISYSLSHPIGSENRNYHIQLSSSAPPSAGHSVPSQAGGRKADTQRLKEKRACFYPG